ncbi:MAG TPA: hypothetical protein VG734_14050 [Lacunisphaera sp.]|nr:hypothetical protein [Lacunisphaera sp.]
MLRHFTRFHTVAFWCTCVYVFLVHNQMWTRDGAYASDTAGHANYVLQPGQAELSGYSLLHTICGVFYGLPNVAEANHFMIAAGVMTLLLAGAFYHSLLLVHGYWTEKYPGATGSRIPVLTVTAFVVSMILLVPWVHSAYLGVFTGNPWHNPTYSFARVFAIGAVLAFLRLTDPEKAAAGISVTGYLVLATAATLSAWSKPSFMLTLGPTFGLVALLAWLRGKMTWTQVWRLAACLVPTVVVVLIIRQKIFAHPGASNAVVIRPGLVWGHYASSYALALAFGAGFPLYVAAVRWRSISPGLFVGLVNWVVSALVFYLFAEDGSRALHANFAWSYMGGLFFFFLFAMEEWFLRSTTDRTWLRWVGLALFVAHGLSGLRYLLIILGGGSYL